MSDRAVRVVVVYHSESGRTRALADAVARGAAGVAGLEARTIDAATAQGAGDALAAADAIVFGCPTYMGSASAAFKAFMDSTAPVWALQGWRDKLAAGFTHSAAPSGDKLGTLVQLATFAAQHGMIWVGLGLPPSYASAAAHDAGRDESNRLGSHLGAMAQSTPGSGHGPAPGDLRTCEHLGRRVAEHAVRWHAGRGAVQALAGDPPSDVRHRAAASWVFPPAGRAPIEGLRRVSLRELAARPERFEHHLVVVARVGDAQLELATASEPLYFAHVNVSDEYAIALPTGDEIVDRFPLRTFLTDAATGEDVARYNHRIGDLVLHPLGLMHWPGRLRPPYEPIAIPRGMRRCGLSLVFCACTPTPVADRPLAVSEGRAADAKSYVSPSPPLVLLDARREKDRELARVGRATLDLRVRPRAIAAPRGAYVVVLEGAEAGPHHACDLVHIPPGGVLDATGIARALVFASDAVDASAPPGAWDRLPDALFAPFEAGPRAPLPFTRAGLTATEADAAHVAIAAGGASAVVPRHWLARMLFRIGLHRPALGYVETYGGFFYDDRRAADAGVAIGIRGGAPVVLPHDAALALVESLYRAVAPEGYTERCPD